MLVGTENTVELRCSCREIVGQTRSWRGTFGAKGGTFPIIMFRQDEPWQVRTQEQTYGEVNLGRFVDVSGDIVVITRADTGIEFLKFGGLRL